MDNDIKNSKIPEFEDESFRLDDMDEYPGEIPGDSQPSSASSRQSTVNSQQSIDSRQQSVRSGKGLLLALLFIAGLALIIMFCALIYDWGVNRGGFDDIANIFGSEKKEIVKGKEVIVEKDLPEYEEYMESKKSEMEEGNEVYEEETVEQPEAFEIPDNMLSNPDRQKPKVTKPATAKQTQDSKVDLEDVPYPDNVNNRIRKSPVKEADYLFTVQVYASPSQDDAEAWKEKLLKQNISDVSITTQKIKNRDWFRVRFGTFNSAGEARKAAIKSGFANAWVDRVK
ncbi:MAG: SPOR domain-containing protein [bacterium]